MVTCPTQMLLSRLILSIAISHVMFEFLNRNLHIPSCFTFDFNKNQHPWNRNGADITDYFNFGFNEDSFRLYATKIRQLAEHFDKKITKDPKVKENIIVEPRANILKDSLPLELGGISQTLLS